MALFPDLAACKIRFMHFRFHLTDGQEFLDSFWESQGLDRSRERLVLGEYKRAQVPHTVFITWSRSHDSCSDVDFGLDSTKASNLFPNRGAIHRKITQATFREFFDSIQTRSVPGGIRSFFGFPLKSGPTGTSKQQHVINPIRLAYEILDNGGKRVVTIELVRDSAHWLSVIEPAGRREFLKEPVSDAFFREAYQTGCALSESLGRRSK